MLGLEAEGGDGHVSHHLSQRSLNSLLPSRTPPNRLGGGLAQGPPQLLPLGIAASPHSHLRASSAWQERAAVTGARSRHSDEQWVAEGQAGGPGLRGSFGHGMPGAAGEVRGQASARPLPQVDRDRSPHSRQAPGRVTSQTHLH